MRLYSQAVAVHSRGPAGSWSTRPEHRPVHKPARQRRTKPPYWPGSRRSGRRRWPGPRRRCWSATSAPTGCCRAWSGSPAPSRERVDWACGVALERRCFRYQTLSGIVEAAAARAPTAALRQRHELIRDLAEYAPC